MVTDGNHNNYLCYYTVLFFLVMPATNTNFDECNYKIVVAV